MIQQHIDTNQAVVNPSPLKAATKYGICLGLATTALGLVQYLMDLPFDSALQYLGFPILGLFLFLGMTEYRQTQLDGFMTYKQAVASGTLIALIGGVIGSAYMLLYMNVLAPDAIDQILAATEKTSTDRGFSPEDIAKQLATTKKMMQPSILFPYTLGMSIFIGFLFSLIVAAFTKKDKPMFN